MRDLIRWSCAGWRPSASGDIGGSVADRSCSPGCVVAILTVVLSVTAGLGFRRAFLIGVVVTWRSRAHMQVFSSDSASQWVPAARVLDIRLVHPPLAPQLTWTLTYGLYHVRRHGAVQPSREEPRHLAPRPGRDCAKSSSPSCCPASSASRSSAFTFSSDEFPEPADGRHKNTLALEVWAIGRPSHLPGALR